MYRLTGLNYNEMLDGKMVLFGNYPGDVFRFLIKENATQCMIRLYEIKNDMMTPDIILKITDFQDPKVDHQHNGEKSLNHKLQI